MDTYVLNKETKSIVPKKKELKITEIPQPHFQSKKSKNKKMVTFIGVTGGQGSGKSKVVNYVISNFNGMCEVINEKSFFQKCTKPRQLFCKDDKSLFDDFPEYSKERRLYLIDSANPDCYNYEQMYEILKKIRNREKAKIPVFDEERMKVIKHKEIDPERTPIIIIEGYFFFNYKKIMDMLGFKIYIDVQDDIRLSRLILREEKYLKKNLDAYQKYFTIYEHYIKEVFDKIIFNHKRIANVLLQDFKINENLEIEKSESLDIICAYMIKNYKEYE